MDAAHHPHLDGRVDEVPAKRGRDQERVGRKDPNGSHCVDGEDQGGPLVTVSKLRPVAPAGARARANQYQVDARRGENGDNNPHPKQYLHRSEQPGARVGYAVLAYIDQDGADPFIKVRLWYSGSGEVCLARTRQTGRVVSWCPTMHSDAVDGLSLTAAGMKSDSNWLVKVCRKLPGRK